MAHNPARLALLVCSLSLLGLHCTLFTDEKAPEPLTTAHLFPACGPTDGPTFTAYLTEEKISCAEADRMSRSNLPGRSYIYLFSDRAFAPEVPSKLTLGIEASASPFGGWAGRCDTPENCVNAVRGTAVFTAPPGDAPKGSIATLSVELVFEDSTRTSGEHLLRQCEPAWWSPCG